MTTLEWEIWRSVIKVQHVDARRHFEMKFVFMLNATWCGMGWLEKGGGCIFFCLFFSGDMVNL
jgi:hypothetical protein